MTNSTWQKSSRSGSHDDCVEVRTSEALIELRESDDGDVVIRTTSTAFADLLRTIKADALDHHA
ncbi:DUF397 domain-containing protein [Kitasatospora misakiensis]|uniref:DUF397 domain-containing protein n=1 Tax=Kitasatospora misakiensis TaxID=67330 RepID=A0ABW0XH17_9ACTN